MPVPLAAAIVCDVTNAASSELRWPAGEYDLVCRCTDGRCRYLVQLEQEEYEILHSDPKLFVVAPGHERGCHGDVLIRADRYVVVRTRERSQRPTAAPPVQQSGIELGG